MKLSSNQLRILALSLAVAVVLSFAARLVLGHRGNHAPAEKQKVEKPEVETNVPLLLDPPSLSAEPDDAMQDNCEPMEIGWQGVWRVVIEAVEAKTPPLAVLVALLCCVFLGPRWLRISICLIVLAAVASCNHKSGRTTGPLDDCSRAGCGKSPAPKTELFQRNLTN